MFGAPPKRDAIAIKGKDQGIVGLKSFALAAAPQRYRACDVSPPSTVAC